MQNISTWPQIAQDCGRLEGVVASLRAGAAPWVVASLRAAAGTGVTGLD